MFGGRGAAVFPFAGEGCPLAILCNVRSSGQPPSPFDTLHAGLRCPAYAQPSFLLAVLLVLFGASGCAALIYEVAWYQVLQLAIGSTSVSLGILLATFMGGLCLGSLALPRWRRAESAHPLRVYAALELGIGVLGVLVTAGMPLISAVYVTGAEHGLPGMLLRGVVAAVAMLPSTILMGASLPAIVRWIENTPEGVSWWALLYGANTAGAVLGCLVAGFYLAARFRHGHSGVGCCRTEYFDRGAELLAEPPHSRANRGAAIGKARTGDSGCSSRFPALVDHLSHHRPFRRLRARRGSGLDPPPEHAPAGHRLCVLDYFGRLSCGPRCRWRGSFVGDSPHAARAGPWLVPDPADADDPLDCGADCQRPPLLERRSHHHHQPLADVRARSEAVRVGGAPGVPALGREFSTGLRGSSAFETRRSGPRYRRGLCSQYPRRHCRRVAGEPAG